MKYLVTGKEMKLLDQNTSEHFHMPTSVLMEQAAMIFVQKLLLIKKPNKVLVLAGNGNNGGDAIAIARLLNQQGIDTALYLATDKTGSDLYELQKKIYNEYAYNTIEEINPLLSFDVIIDGLFGIGLSRDVTGEYARLINLANGMSGLKVAIDISSGVSADTGDILGIAFNANYTITFSFEKIGQLIWPGCDYSGEIIVAPIGITDSSFLERKPSLLSLEKEDLTKLPDRPMHSNKGTFGKLLIIGGSINMAGAVSFSAKAAYRTGVGLVRVVSHDDNRIIIQNSVPEAVYLPLFKRDCEEELVRNIKWADAIVIGPGIGQDEISRFLLKCVLANSEVPVIIDADGLNILSGELEMLEKHKYDIIVTPHLGEMSRLTELPIQYLQTHLIDSARDFANQYDIICVLKDFRTVIACPYGEAYLNMSGNNGMATAGSGDVLSGIIGALLAQGLNAKEAASYGCLMHGMAGDRALQFNTTRSMMAGDIIEALSFI